MKYLKIAGFISYVFLSSVVQAQDELNGPNLLPIGLVSDTWSRYWSSESSLSTLEALKKDDGRFWYMLTCEDSSCSIQAEQPIIKGNRLLIPFLFKNSLVAYLKLDGIKPARSVPQWYVNPSAKHFYSDLNQDSTFPVPLKLGNVNLSIESDKHNVRFVIQTDKKRQVIEQKTLGEKVIFIVLWAGDLDGDGKTDLIYEYTNQLDTSQTGSLKLMLSSFAAINELMHTVGLFYIEEGS